MVINILKNNFDLVNKSALANLAGFLVRLGARLPFLFVVAFLFGKELFGQYLFAVTCVETLTVLFLFGLKRSMFQFLDGENLDDSQGNFNHVVMSSIFICLAIGLIVISSIYLSVSYFSNIMENQMLRGLVILLPTSLVYGLAEILLTATRAMKIVRYEVMAKSIIEPYSLTIFSVLFFYSGFVENGLFIAYWCMSIVVLSYTIYVYKKNFPIRNFFGKFSFNKSYLRLKLILQRSVAVAIDDLLMVLMLRVDVYFLAALTTPKMLGIYGICLQIITIVKKIKQSFDPILEPVIASIIKITNLQYVASELARVSNLIFWIQATIFTFLIFYSDDILSLFGIADENAALTLLFLVGSVVISSIFGLSELVFLNKNPKINFYISTTILIVHIILCYFLISNYGILGAGICMLISYSLRSFVQLYLLKKMYNIFPLDTSLLVSACGSIILGTYLYIVNNYLEISPVLAIVIGIAGGVMIITSYSFIMKSMFKQRYK